MASAGGSGAIWGDLRISGGLWGVLGYVEAAKAFHGVYGGISGVPMGHLKVSGGIRRYL